MRGLTLLFHSYPADSPGNASPLWKTSQPDVTVLTEFLQGPADAVKWAEIRIAALGHQEAFMEVFIEHLGDVQFEIRARSHTIECDQPIENGGYDEGMTPPELLLASLGSCAAYYAADYLRRQKLATEGTRVHVTAEKAKNPARLVNFRVGVELPLELSEQHQAGVEDAVKHCLIHNTLLNPSQISIEIHQLVETAT